MTLQSSGQITMANLAAEFNRPDSEGLHSYYRGGTAVPATRTVTGTATKNTTGETTDFASVTGLTIRRSDVTIGAASNTGTASDTTVGGIDVDVTTGQSWTDRITNGNMTFNSNRFNGTGSQTAFEYDVKTGSKSINTQKANITFTTTASSTWATSVNGSWGAADYMGITGGGSNYVIDQSYTGQGGTPSYLNANSSETPAQNNPTLTSVTIPAGSYTLNIRGGTGLNDTASDSNYVNTTITTSGEITWGTISGDSSPTITLSNNDTAMTNGVTITFQNQNPYSVALSSTSTGGARTLAASQSSGTTVQDGTSMDGNTSSNWVVASANINDTGNADGYAGGFGVTVADGTDIAAVNTTGTTDNSDVGGFAVDVIENVGALGTLGTRLSVGSGTATYTVQSTDALVAIRIQSEDKDGGSSTPRTYASFNPSVSGITNGSSQSQAYWGFNDNTGNGTSAIADYSTSDPRNFGIAGTGHVIRGPAYVSGDTMSGGQVDTNFGQLTAGTVITLARGSGVRSEIVTRRRTNTFDVTFQNNNSFPVTTLGTASGGAQTYTAGQKRTVVDNSSSTSWRVAYAAIDRYDISMQNNNNTSTAVAANTTGGARTFTQGQTVTVGDDVLSTAWTLAFGSATAYTYAAKNGTGVDGTANNVTILAADSDSFTNFDSNNSSASLSVAWSSTEQINEGVPEAGEISLHDFYGATAT